MLYIFDVGNVVVKGIEVLAPTAELLGINKKEFFQDWYAYETPLMDGTFTLNSYYKHIEHKFNVKIESQPITDFFDPHFNKPMVEVIDYLRERGNRIVCGSNTFKQHWDMIVEIGLNKIFDKCYLSHKMGISKPAPAFYRYILESENIKPSDAFFTDDLEENVNAAAELGINTLWYKTGFDNSKLMEFFNKQVAKHS